jgi:hypothetical protein
MAQAESQSGQQPQSTSGPGPGDKQQQEKQKQSDQMLEKLVDSQPLVGSGFKSISRCKLCGWQTMQMDEETGKKLVKNHAQIHIPQIQATMQSGGGQQQQKGHEQESK